ncbi:hypothetical protein JKP88DRAFT_349675 [Tribonema minus]|uniref:Uncharacterized protein n=1 Tax=Tribonema minus TaxID=303371 RepID=A0A835YRI5_9STRA|nr:hypothetical protein JKP88DRAFT_349675 [Tribonema minus]
MRLVAAAATAAALASGTAAATAGARALLCTQHWFALGSCAFALSDGECPRDWLHIAGVCPAWRDVYWSQFESKRTSYNRAAESISRLALSWPPLEVSKWGYVLWPAIGEEGHVPVVEWAIQTYCPNGVAPSHVLDNITDGAARGRRLPLLQWAFDRGALSQYHMTNIMLAHATSVRGLPVFLWAWEHKFCNGDARLLARLAQSAARNGCVGVLAHMYARLGGDEFRRKLCHPGCWLHEPAVEGCQLQVLEWLVEHDALPPRNARPRIDACEEAALAADNPDVIAWLREAGFGWGSDVCTRAAERGHLNVLKWLRDTRCPAWESAGQELCVAATHGTVEVLEWLRAAGKGRWDNAGVEELIRGSLEGPRLYSTYSIRMRRRTPIPQGDGEEAAASASTNGAPVWSPAMFAIADDMAHPPCNTAAVWSSDAADGAGSSDIS